MKQTPRTRKLNETAKEALATIIARDISDPRLDLTTVTSVDVASDLSIANVFVTAHGGDERYREVLEGLESARGRIRSLFGRAVRMRVTPELRFYIDESVDTGMRIQKALENVPPTLAKAATIEEPEDGEPGTEPADG